jgi:hypothetical protein
MTTRGIATLFAAVLAFAAVAQVFLPLKARAQDHSPHHADFYRHWMQPGVSPPLSCCNARVEVDGVETGDCEPTRAEIRGGRWWAWLRQEDRWIPIADGKIVRERNPTGQDAHLCWSFGRVLCFVPPDTGG